MTSTSSISAPAEADRGDEIYQNAGFVRRVLLVDLDGTLLDTSVAVEAAWTRAAEQIGIDPTAFGAFMHGIPAAQVLEHVAPFLGEAERSRIANQVLADQARDDAVVSWLPGAERFVQSLEGVCWAVVTSGTRRLATSSMRKAGMSDPPIMVTADDVGVGKPDPAPYLRAAYLLKTSPADCLVIEDSPAGISSARQARMTVVGVTGTYPATRLRDATLVLDQLPEVEILNDQEFVLRSRGGARRAPDEPVS